LAVQEKGGKMLGRMTLEELKQLAKSMGFPSGQVDIAIRLTEVADKLGFTKEQLEEIQFLTIKPLRTVEIEKYLTLPQSFASQSLREQIERTWQIFVESRGSGEIYNGNLASVLSFTERDGILKLLLRSSDFKKFIGTKHLTPRKVDVSRHVITKSCWPLSFGALAVTRDDRIPYALRSGKVTVCSNMLHIPPSGYFEPDKHAIEDENKPGKEPSILQMIISELLEELNIEWFERIDLLGFIHDGVESMNPLLALRMLLPYTGDEVLSRFDQLPERREVDTLQLVDNSIEAVRETAICNRARWSPHDVAKLILHFADL